ncbi:MAG: hypothetical protein OXC42_08580 [Gammaproteobacteria bacterium]|nr:hypothetical protein [Gammaproteobacteria bacterium]
MSEVINVIVTSVSKFPEFWSAIGGSLGGTIGGGLIAYAVQHKALREGRMQRKKDHRLAQQVLGTSLLIKLLKIHSNFHAIHQHFEKALAAERQPDAVYEPWQLIQPFASLPQQVNFTPEELSMLTAIGDFDVFNSVFSMDVVHNAVIDGCEAYRIQRAKLTDMLPVEDVSGYVVVTALTDNQASALQPQMIAVNSVIEELITRVKAGSEESKSALDRTQKLLRDKLELPYSVEVTS